MLKGEDPPFCVGCNEPLRVAHILVKCIDFSEISLKYYWVINLKTWLIQIIFSISEGDGTISKNVETLGCCVDKYVLFAKQAKQCTYKLFMYKSYTYMYKQNLALNDLQG